MVWTCECGTFTLHHSSTYCASFAFHIKRLLDHLLALLPNLTAAFQNLASTSLVLLPKFRENHPQVLVELLR